MATYSFKAITPTGAAKEGSLEAASEAQVLESLHAQGLIPIKIQQGRVSAASNDNQAKPKTAVVCTKKGQTRRHYGADAANVIHVACWATVGSGVGYLVRNQ